MGAGIAAAMAAAMGTKTEKELAKVKNAFTSLNNHFETVESENLFNKDGELISGKAIKTSDGSLVDFSSYSVQYIPFKGEGTYTVLFPYDYYGTNKKLCLYNSEKEYLRTIDGTGNPPDNEPYPCTFQITGANAENVAYIGYCMKTTRLGEVMVVKSATYPEEYIPYSENGVYFDGKVDASNVTGLTEKTEHIVDSKKTITPTISGGIQYSDGKLVSSAYASGYTRTDYIPYAGESFILTNIRCGNTYCAIGYYDKDKKYISGVKQISADIVISATNVPSNTVFVVFASNTNNGTIDKVYGVSGLAGKTEDLIQQMNDVNRVPLRMEFGAHNGAEFYAPECSIPAYRIAGQQGWEWAWISGIYFSADGTMYVMHDATVDRTTDGTGTISQLTDEYINSLHIDLAGKGYNISDFQQSDLVVPTFEQILRICVKYGMKMVIRVDQFPNEYTSADAIAKWDGLLGLLKAYNVPETDVCFYIGTGFAGSHCRDHYGSNVCLAYFGGMNFTAQDCIDWFTSKSLTGNLAHIIYINKADLSNIKLLHTNGIKAFVYGIESITEVETLALNGADICQNGKYYKLNN